MRALTVRGGILAIESAPDPIPFSNQALVRSTATSLNRGECASLTRLPDGAIPGWDVVGVVERAAEDGSGPDVGSRVCGIVRTGAWAQLVAVPTHGLAPIPADVSDAHAAALPVAALTAWRALQMYGLLLDRRVLVTGGAGGVGRIAIQLAALSGAHVTAVTSSEDRAAGLEALGAHRVVREAHDPAEGYDLVLESAAGPSLATALSSVRPDGVLVWYGRSSRTPAEIPTDWFMTHSEARIIPLFVFTEVDSRRIGTSDLAHLMSLVGSGQLDPQVTVTADWTSANDVVTDLLERRLIGKATLTFS